MIRIKHNQWENWLLLDEYVQMLKWKNEGEITKLTDQWKWADNCRSTLDDSRPGAAYPFNITRNERHQNVRAVSESEVVSLFLSAAD